MSIDKSLRMLVDDIKSSKEFRALQEAKLKLNKYKDVKKDMETLQKRQMQLYNSKRSAKELETDMNALNSEYKRLSNKPEVVNMIKAGEGFNKLMGSIYLDISKKLDGEL